MANAFEYNDAFSRNIGWVTENELQRLRSKRIAIAGLGGVGGAHLLVLTRLGFGAFSISDLDVFEVANLNRQFGATLSNIGRSKVDVMEDMALDINPELNIRTFPTGVNEANVDDFLMDADLYIDGLDFFEMEAREAVFAACSEKGIPALTAAPLGWGVAMLVFSPGSMTFEEYFQMAGCPHAEKLRRFLVGLSPTGLQLEPLVDATRLDVENHRGPSTVVGACLCAGVVATNAVKMVLGRGDVPAVPKSCHFDAFLNEHMVVERSGGMSHPEMQARLALLQGAAAN